MYRPYDLESAVRSRFDYDLDLRDHPNATVCPIASVNMPKNSEAAIFDRDGIPIVEAGLDRNWGPILAVPPKPTGVEYRDEHVMFGGYIAHHYGHFLLESLARIWACQRSDLPIVWAAGRELRPMQIEILGMLGIDPARHVVLRRPTRFARIRVATPGYIIRRNFHHVQRDALAVRECVPGSAKVYLSRSRFVSKIANIANEDAVEAILERAGWRIVHPELLSFREQLDIFAHSSTVAGIEGSALHTAIFCRNPRTRVVMLRRQQSNGNYDTIAKATGLDQHDIARQIRDVAGDRVAATIVNPAECAELIRANA